MLWMALQACPSNPSYDIFENPKADETAMLLDLTSITAAKASLTHNRVSKMPAAPFEGGNNHVRYDSVIGAPGGYNAFNLSLSQLWHIVLQGATDPSKTASAAKELLLSVWPASTADGVLEIIGDPAKPFAWDNKLRSDIQTLLFPSYTTISSTPQH